MKIVRTYPRLNPETVRGRNRVDDEYERAYIADYDNRSLFAFKDDLVVLEWDIAVSLGDLELFCQTAGESPERVMVAPYRLYPPSDPNLPNRGVYAHRKVTNPATLSTTWVTEGDWTCDLFSFGMAYLPHELIRRFCEAPNPADPRMTDANFSVWHYRNVKHLVPIHWGVRPVHLHYTVPKEYPWN